MHNNDDQMKQQARIDNLKNIRHKIVVMSGKGGVGKSTVSVNLAYALLMKGNRVGIIDADFHGPSIAKMTGIENLEFMADSVSGRPLPIQAMENLHILSIASLLKDKDDAVIWRGPMKMGVIKQFFEDFQWPELDYLIVDCPPGTGDEPLSIIQTIGSVSGCVIVSTPQDVAFLDARKTISFANKLNVPIIGIIENMSGFICPKCGEKIDIFKTGGAEKAAADFGLDILGKIPLDGDIVHSGDDGKPYVYHNQDSAKGKLFIDIADKISESVMSNEKCGCNHEDGQSCCSNGGECGCK